MSITDYDRGWLMGFIEGEGSFFISVRGCPNQRYKYNLQISPRFAISLHEKDKEVLEEIQTLMGAGIIKLRSFESLRKKGMRSSDQFVLVCQNIEGCLQIKELLQKSEWKTTKKKDFDLWCQALEIIRLKEHTSPEGILKICQLRDQMNNPGKKKKGYRSAESIGLYLKSNFGWSPSKNIFNVIA